MTGLFLTGTDTGVGKTTVAAGILASLRRRNLRVSALKPAETGCARAPDGSLIPEDAALLAQAAGDEIRAPFRYATPVAPAVAARLEGLPFDVTRVLDTCDDIRRRRPDLFLVEGAGGLLAPYDDALLGADLASRLGLPVLLVARASLGTINHTLLTLFEARRRGLSIAGVILNRVIAEVGPDEPTNASEIVRLGAVEILGTVAHVAHAQRRDPSALADAVDAAFDPTRLLRP